MRMLDLFCGRWGWSKSFALRGWECVGVDLVRPSEIPERCTFVQRDIMEINNIEDLDWNILESDLLGFDFVCASPPCEQFSVHGMRHFHPDAPYPELGVRLFRRTQTLCEKSGLPYVIENVRPAQKFVGWAQGHAGSFYLWGNAVPPLLSEGFKKGLDMGRDPVTGKRTLHLGRKSSYKSKARAQDKAITATIPQELASCVADYAERLIEQRAMAR